MFGAVGDASTGKGEEKGERGEGEGRDSGTFGVAGGGRDGEGEGRDSGTVAVAGGRRLTLALFVGG